MIQKAWYMHIRYPGISFLLLHMWIIGAKQIVQSALESSIECVMLCIHAMTRRRQMTALLLLVGSHPRFHQCH